MMGDILPGTIREVFCRDFPWLSAAREGPCTVKSQMYPRAAVGAEAEVAVPEATKVHEHLRIIEEVVESSKVFILEIDGTDPLAPKIQEISYDDSHNVTMLGGTHVLL